MKIHLFLLLLKALCIQIESARILSVISTASKSHYASCRNIILELAKRGHDVVSVSPFEEKNAPSNFKWVEIEIKSVLEVVADKKLEMKETVSFFKAQKQVWTITNEYTKHILKLPKLKKFIESDNSKFDIVIVEEFFQPIFYMLSYKYKAPLALISSFGSAHYMSEFMCNPLELSYIPHEFSEMYGDMTIWERTKNIIYTIFDLIGRNYYVVSEQNGMAKYVFKNLKDMPKLEDLERNVSLILMNSHFSMSAVRPYLPNIVEVGGTHIDKSRPLNQEFKKILDEAQTGVLLFSLGSMLELSELPVHQLTPILTALGKIPQRVLLKWNTKVKLPVTYPNIFPVSWQPQNDVLAHPNVIGFVTHGGLLSAQEAVYHGVPTICIPFFGDQPLNCRRSVIMGYGIQLSIMNLTETVLYDAIESLTKDKKYKQAAQDLSKRFRGRQNSPLETATFWIEYVIEHKGAEFMRSKKRNLSWYQYYAIDIGLIAIFVIWILKRVVFFAFSLLFKNDHTKKVKIN